MNKIKLYFSTKWYSLPVHYRKTLMELLETIFAALSGYGMELIDGNGNFKMAIVMSIVFKTTFKFMRAHPTSGVVDYVNDHKEETTK